MLSMQLISQAQISHMKFSFRRVEYDDRSESLLRALQQNVDQHVQMVGLSHTP